MSSSQISIIETQKFNQFISEEMTLKNAREFQDELNNRFQYIVNKIGEITGFQVEWFDYHNESEHHQGFFDSHTYKHHVQYVGAFNYEKNVRFNKYDEFFPIEWFYTPFEDNLMQEKEQFLQNYQNKQDFERQKKLQNFEKFSQLKEQVLKKLTDEEKSIIQFTSPDVLLNKSSKNKKQ